MEGVNITTCILNLYEILVVITDDDHILKTYGQFFIHIKLKGGVGYLPVYGVGSEDRVLIQQVEGQGEQLINEGNGGVIPAKQPGVSLLPLLITMGGFCFSKELHHDALILDEMRSWPAFAGKHQVGYVNDLKLQFIGKRIEHM